MILSLTLLISLIAGLPLEGQAVDPGSQTPQSIGAYIALDKNHENWEVLTDSTKIPFRVSCWVRVEIPCQDREKMVLKGGDWYMRGMHFYNAEWDAIGSGNFVDLNGQLDQLVYVYYPFIDEKKGRIEISILGKSEYIQSQSDKDQYQIGFFSIYIFVALVLVLFALRSRDKLYWHFFFYVTTTAYFFAYQYGLLGAVFPIADRISPTWWWISSASISLAYAFFAQSFLGLREKNPAAYNLFEFGKYFIGLVILAEVTAHVLSFDLQHQLAYKLLLLLVEIPLMFFIIYRIYKMEDILSRIFLLGMLILAISSLSGQFLSTLRLTAETNYLIQTGMLIDIIIFSVGVSIRIGLVYKAREKVKENLIEQLRVNEEFQQKYTLELEQTVKQRTAELDSRNEENELLLREVHHRVKNNLQMISSLLNMQNRRIKDTKSKEAFKLTQSRLQSIGLIHEHLYQQNNFSKLNLKIYVEDLVAILVGNIDASNKADVKADVQELWAEIDTAIPIGLVLNELVTNAIKYAFPSVKKPSLKIELKEMGDHLFISIKDNGQILAPIAKGFGWTIIDSTLSSVGGESEILQDGGLDVRIRISDYVVSHSS